MNVLITGASGFVGRALVAALLQPKVLSLQVDRLKLLDLTLDSLPDDPRIQPICGSIADVQLVRAAMQDVDLVFHLASVPGGVAERNYELGRDINLGATQTLIEAARALARPPVFVFASSIAVLGSPLPPLGVDDSTPCAPKLSYGAHKLVGEILVADSTRRGWIDGRSVRLPGIVARPSGPSGLISAFLSDIIRELSGGRAFHCPIAPGATTWLMSVPCLVANLLHAAQVDGALLGDGRACTLPALCVSMTELVAAIGEVYDVDAASLISYGADAAIEANFGRYPGLQTQRADRAGFKHDGHAQALVRAALN